MADTTKNYIRLKPGDYVVDKPVLQKTVTIDGYGSTLAYATTSSELEVADGGNVTLMGVSVDRTGGSLLFRCDGNSIPSLTLIDVTASASNYVLFATGCKATAERSTFHETNANGPVIVVGNSGSTLDLMRTVIDGGDGVYSIAGANAKAENCVFTNQTGPNGAMGGVSFLGSTRGFATASFSTFVNTRLVCENGTPTCASSSGVNGICVSNSIIVGPTSGDAVQGGCIVNNSLITHQSASVAGQNNQLNADPKFTSAVDLTPLLTSPAVDAVPTTVISPATDFAGTKRPQGARSDLGAYEAKQ